MAKEKSLVEEAILQMKNLEEAVAENAKGILASTMKEEINELVKESLTEQDDEVETDVEMDADMEEPEGSEMEVDMDTDNETEDEEGMEMSDMDSEEMSDDDMEEPIDLTGESDEEVLRVFKLMGPEDSVIVKKDEAGNISLKDEDSDKEYMIVGEGVEEDEMYEGDMEMSEMDEESMDDESIEDIVSKVFSDNSEMEMNEMDHEEEMDEMHHEMDEESEEMDEVVYEIEMDDEEMNEESDEEEMDEVVYEIEMDDEDEMDEEEDILAMMESKSIKPKGVGIGNGPKKNIYSKKPNMSGGFKTKMKQGPRAVGTGKAKFEYKEGENLNGKMKTVKKVETKEASRTLGSGSNFRKGGLPKPRAHSKFNTAIQESETINELNVLREKNEEYRKALNIFRNKLNEVAVFNSNLAYATRLFTEHSTSKQEKINILKRFDSVESLKESKNLYKTIKEELTQSTGQTVNESIERTIERTPSNGSSANLIESKTYENPQFLRMKDLMAKIK